MKRIIAAVLAAIAAIAGIVAPAHAGDAPAVPYIGTMFRKDTVCIINKVNSDQVIKDAVTRAIRDWSNLTDATFKNNRESCAGYTHQVIVWDSDFGATGWIGKVFYDADQPWTYGYTQHGTRKTWLTGNTVQVRLNTHYHYYSAAQWTRVARHELGHVLGLDHDTRCGSVMTPYGVCDRYQLTITDRDIRAVNTLRSW